MLDNAYGMYFMFHVGFLFVRNYQKADSERQILL